MSTVISIHNLGKKYRITHKKVRYEALRDIISYAILNPFGYLKSRTKKIIGRDTREEFWALDGINLDINKGEVIGIIGRNGAGKSTLLKILTGITPPTTGEVKINGRVASLLEVGTGFHPELTGRENIFLNGAILGMTKGEIEKKFDQIVEFSGINKFLDTQVKRYSSGMQVRLAFSVAAHLEPDILLVDEVLAVGDAEFQKKCLGKMDEVTRTAGRTILFVSHNMDAISRLCKKSILLDQGKVVAFGETDTVIERYLTGGYRDGPTPNFPITDSQLTLNSFTITQDGKEAYSIDGGKSCTVNINFSVTSKLQSFRAGILLKNSSGTILSRSYLQDWESELEIIQPGRYSASLIIPARLLIRGEYQFEVKFFCQGGKYFFADIPIQKPMTVHNPKEFNEVRSKSGYKGYFLIPNEWEVHSKES